MARCSVPRFSQPTVCVLVAVALSLTHSPAYGWGAKGHQIVAYIAEAHLSDATRQRLAQLLPKNETLVQAATWPDRVKKAMPQSVNKLLETLREH